MYYLDLGFAGCFLLGSPSPPAPPRSPSLIVTKRKKTRLWHKTFDTVKCLDFKEILRQRPRRGAGVRVNCR